MTNENKGCIYIMTNKYMPGLVKIGYADDVERRRKELSNTSVAADFEIYGTYQVPVRLADKALHKLIQRLNPSLKVNVNREFFEMSPEDAFDILEAIATITDTKDALEKRCTAIAICSKPKGTSITKSVAADIVDNKDKNFFIIHNGRKAILNVVNDEYVVRAGSTIWINIDGNNSNYDKYEADLKSGLIFFDGENWTLRNDKIFKTPSGAGKYVNGYATNGWVAWKAKDGTLLKDYK